MLAQLLTWAACLALVSGQTATKVPPPPNRGVGNYPAFYIYQDIDQLARPGGNLTACAGVKTQRSVCYNLGIQKGSYAAEQECLCDPTTAFQVVQCFAYEYSTLKNETLKASLYQSFLYYTYDCYCGVNPAVDPTYDTSVNPVQPYIVGYTGDAILPPVGGCPQKGAPSNVCPKPPPCNNCDVPQPPLPQPCPSGYKRCSGQCIPDCPPTPPCASPKIINKQGQCVCPYGFLPVGANSCEPPECGPNMEYVIGPNGGKCQCDNGYDWDNATGQCLPICPVGEKRTTPGGPCQPVCTAPLIPDWSGNCVCPWSLGYVEVNGVCQLFTCVAPLVVDPYYLSCYCPDPYYVANDGSCVLPVCYDLWNPACYPGLNPPSNSTYAIASATPSFSLYSDIATEVGPSTFYSSMASAASVVPPPLPPTSTQESAASGTPTDNSPSDGPVLPSSTPAPGPPQPSETGGDTDIPAQPSNEVPSPPVEPSEPIAPPPAGPTDVQPSARRRFARGNDW